MGAFQQRLESGDKIVADGATGTNLFAMGLTAGDAPEQWLTNHPDRVSALHEGFVQAGSQLILTNSFGGNRFRLKLHGLEGQAFELNKRAAEIARAAADKVDREVIVAGSMGPTGELLEPLGEMTREGCVAAFTEQAEGLKAGGADVLWIETLSAIEELECAVEAAKTTGLPVCATMSFDTAGRTMMGLTPGDFALLAKRLELDAFGANCGTGAPDLLLAIGGFAEADVGIPIIAKANCGIPQFVDGEIVYSGTAELMANYTHLAIDLGASIVGGCCGTTAVHVKAIAEAVRGHEPREKPDLAAITAGVGAPIQTGAGEGADSSGGKKRARRRRRD